MTATSGEPRRDARTHDIDKGVQFHFVSSTPSPNAARASRSSVARSVAVASAPLAASDVVRHGVNVGFGALGLVRHAVGVALARTVPAARNAPPSPPTTTDLLPGAVMGLGILVQRRVRAVGTAVSHGASGVAHSVGAPAAVQRAFRPVEDLLWRWNEVARREQAHNRAEASAVVPVLVQQVAENIVSELDFERLVRRIPVEDIVAQVDVEAIVARIDLGGVIRESTVTVGAEAVEALRAQGMAIDAWSARVVDRLLFRKQPRRIEVGPT